VDVATEEERGPLLRHILARTPVDWAEGEGTGDRPLGATPPAVSLGWLVRLSAGYSLAQLGALCREAAMAALREDMGAPAVRAVHFEEAARRARQAV
jgi:SpoVK/Ycf46/Vps4 family AAA+-type ATPase